MPKLLLIVPLFESYRVFLRELAESMVEKGWEVHVVCGGTEGLRSLGAEGERSLGGEELRNWGAEGVPASLGLRRDEVIFHGLELPRSGNLLGLWRVCGVLGGIVDEVRPDVIQAHFSAAAWVLAWMRRREGVRTSGVIQGLAGAARGRWHPLNWAEWWILQRLDATWVLTEDDFAVLRRWNPRKARMQQHALGFGCDLQRFDARRFLAEDRQRIRQRLGIPQDALCFVFVGRRVAFKGFAKLVRAFWRLREEGANVFLLCLGDPDPLHPTGLSRDESVRLQEDPAVCLRNFESDIAPYLYASDTFLLPSQREGMPVSMMEALSMGLPVITSNTRGCRHLVRHNQTGWIVDPITVETLHHAMHRLAQDSKLRARLGESAYGERERFDRRKFVVEMNSSLGEEFVIRDS